MKRYGIFNAFAVSVALSVAMGCSPASKHGHDEHGHGAEDRHDGVIELSQKQMDAVGIGLGTFSTMILGESINAAGELTVDPRHIADVTPVMNGIISHITVREGDMVKTGTVVANIENLEINTLMRDYKESLSSLKLAEREYERQKKLSQHGAGIAKNLERAAIELENAKSMVESAAAGMKLAGVNPGQIEGRGRISAAVKSPISGIVTKIYGKIGSEAGSMQPIMTVIDNSGVYAMVRIYEKDIHKVRKGMPVEISLTNGSGLMQGKVEDVIRAIDSESKTIDVRVGISGADKTSLIPGMAVNAYISTGEAEVTALPEEAVVTIEGKDYIYMLAQKENHDGEEMSVFRLVEVVKGNSRNGFVEVNPVEDLPRDARIVVSKAFYIASMAADHGEHNH